MNIFRDRLLSGIIAIVAVQVALQAASASEFPASSFANDFRVYDEIRFKNKPDLSQAGLTPIRVVYAAEMWRKRQVNEQVDHAHLHSFFASPKFRNTSVVVLDIEHWPVDLRRFNRNQIIESIQKYRSVAQKFKSEHPRIQVGFYGVPPIRDYYSPVRNRDMDQWLAANDLLSPIAESVDVIFPSLYTFKNDPADWKRYAIENIREARQYGKPVIPFLWPQFHQSNKFLGGDYMSPEFWRLQLETMIEHADGVIIWTPATNAPEWNQEAPWWQATVDFIENHDLD
ncbi:MAG: hypothetical protein AAF353_17615 [Pseudomonadota bacterium]